MPHVSGKDGRPGENNHWDIQRPSSLESAIGQNQRERPGSAKWKERRDSQKLSSDLQMHAVAHAHTHHTYDELYICVKIHICMYKYNTYLDIFIIFT